MLDLMLELKGINGTKLRIKNNIKTNENETKISDSFYYFLRWYMTYTGIR